MSISLDVFKVVCAHFGIPLALDKMGGPAKVLTFLGFQLNTTTMVVSVPPDKLDQYRTRVHTLLETELISLDDLRSILGCLNWTLAIIIPGRAFLRRLYDATKTLTCPSTMITITHEMKADLRIWVQFLEGHLCHI